jgi:hypothetical protein
MYAALEVAQNASSYVSRQKRKVILLPQALRQPFYLLGIDYLTSTYWQQQRENLLIECIYDMPDAYRHPDTHGLQWTQDTDRMIDLRPPAP